ncbi:alpha/beta hydrolase-fold protein [Hyphomonas sp.]|uniref:carboxylesterase family protein n=1 Tax=Hyphomonas sp. TaxID=87 RepID=UPI0025C49FF2|nr:alpha/beta hydrolase-fold protein [Hyphomonas sp.]
MKSKILAMIVLATSTVLGSNLNCQAQVLVDYESAAKRDEILQEAEWRLTFRPSIMVLQQSVQQILEAGSPDPDQAAASSELLEQSQKVEEPEARKLLWQARAILTGAPWTEAEAALGSLSLTTPKPVWTGNGDVLELSALYPVTALQGGIYSLDLFEAQSTSSATPTLGRKIRHLADGRFGKELPALLPIDLTGVADGSYVVMANLKVGSKTAAEGNVALPVYLLRDLDARYASVKKELATVDGHEDAKATAEYPYALAEAMNAGKREVITFDFPASLSRSKQIIADIKAGNDPVYRTLGLQHRAYRFSETGELLPYQIYVPSSWAPGKKLPLVVALHGANMDETNMLGRSGGQMQTLAEEHGFIVVAPLGYRINSAYGSERSFSGALTKDYARLKRSERDVLELTGRIRDEYETDPALQYLLGNSMGGGGTWWIGGQHPEMWAAIAPVAYGGVIPEDACGLKHVPILVVVGDQDTLMLDRVRDSVATLKKEDVGVAYIEVIGGTHKSAFDIALSQIFDFFQQHRR